MWSSCKRGGIGYEVSTDGNPVEGWTFFFLGVVIEICRGLSQKIFHHINTCMADDCGAKRITPTHPINYSPQNESIAQFDSMSAGAATKTDYDTLSVRDLRQLLALRGHDCSSYVEKDELIAAARRLDATDYDEEARKLFAKLNLQPCSRHRWSNLDAIWRHPSEHGGTVFVGNYVAASNRKTLDERGITCVVNCQDQDSQNYFEKDPTITYFRFPVARLAVSRNSFDHRTGEGALEGFMPVFKFIDEKISAGHSVLVHCLAGAHRAGTCGVAYLMYKANLGVDEAIAVAKKCRPVIGPFATLLSLLRYLELDLDRKRQREEANSS